MEARNEPLSKPLVLWQPWELSEVRRGERGRGGGMGRGWGIIRGG